MTNSIDTNKYEGHAEGEWTIEQNDTGDECAINAQDYGTIAQTFYRDSDKLFYATSRLIADAPLILQALIDERAEVKRLTAMFEETNHHLDLMVGAFGIEALVEMVGEEE